MRAGRARLDCQEFSTCALSPGLRATSHLHSLGGAALVWAALRTRANFVPIKVTAHQALARPAIWQGSAAGGPVCCPSAMPADCRLWSTQGRLQNITLRSNGRWGESLHCFFFFWATFFAFDFFFFSEINFCSSLNQEEGAQSGRGQAPWRPPPPHCRAGMRHVHGAGARRVPRLRLIDAGGRRGGPVT